MKKFDPLSFLFCLVLAGLSSRALQQHFRLSFLLTIPLFLLCLVLFLRARQPFPRRIYGTASVLALFFTTSFLLFRYPSFPQSTRVLSLLLDFFGLFPFFLAALAQLFHVLKGRSLLLPDTAERDLTPRRLALVFCGSLFLLYLWFLLWLLYRFPGCMSPDSNWQLLQARGEMALSNHHPIVHTLIIRLFIRLGARFFPGNPSLSLAAYHASQALILAASFAWLIESLYKFRVRRVPILLLYAGFFLLPYHAAYSVTMLKDVWFSAFVLLLCTSLWRLLLAFQTQANKPPVLDLSLLFLASLGMCLFRTNGLYAFVLLLPFILIFFYKKSRIPVLLSISALVLAAGIRGPLYRALDIIPPDTVESLSIPAQHIARAIVEGASLNEEQEELLSHVMDVSAVPQRYLPYLSDPIKDLIRQTGDQVFLSSHKREFIKLWLQLGLDNPGAYLRAQVELTSGYWYPRTDGIVMYPYFTDTTEASAYCMLPSPLSDIPLFMARLFPRLPVVNLFFSNGAAVWLLLFLFGLCYVNRQYPWLLLFLPAMGIWATLLIATPLNNEFRYAYCLFTSLPLLSILPFSPFSPSLE